MYICVKGAQLMDKSVEKWISSKEAAEYMGINKDTLQRWITNNQIPCHRVGRLWKFKISEIDAWIRSDNNVSCEIRSKMVVKLGKHCLKYYYFIYI